MSPAITMAGAITALVTEKRAVGYKYDAEERVLARFAAFSASQFPGLDAPDRASVEAWISSARERGVKPATLEVPPTKTAGCTRRSTRCAPRPLG
jgi:integrase/recombinase XerD